MRAALTMEMPPSPPVLTPKAAGALLKILRQAIEESDRCDDEKGGDP